MAKKPETDVAGISEADLAKMQAMVAELEAAKAKIAELEAEKAEEAEPEKTAEEAAEDAYWNELVPFEALFDGDKYKDDIIVSVNGKRYQIKRGVKVMIPRNVFNVLMRSQQQDMKTAAMMAAAEREAVRIG